VRLALRQAGGAAAWRTRRRHQPPSCAAITTRAPIASCCSTSAGCGRSTPHASLEENTTWDLVDDIERLREHLGIERWQVLGGSWGSTLGLAYAETYPERLTELLLRGIFTLRRSELEWFYQEGSSWIFPDAFEDYVSVIPEAERGDMIDAYHRRLTHADPAVQLEAARAWSAWEGKTLSLFPDADRVRPLLRGSLRARLCAHRVPLLRQSRLLQRRRPAHRRRPSPQRHPRRDRARSLRRGDAGQDRLRSFRAWPGARLRVVPDAGHAMTEPGIVHELVAATKAFASRAEIALRRVADKVERDIPLMRARAMLDGKHPLPAAEHHAAVLHRDG